MDERALWLDPGFGASGDMILGALIGAGAPIEAVRADVATLGVEGWAIEAGPVTRAGIAATRTTVALAAAPEHHRPWSTIDALLARSDLPPEVAAGARATFRALGAVEAAMHDVEIDEVHFHEVGALDAIVDIVGSWSARHHLGVASVAAGPVGLGSGGHVDAAHGRLPVPAPATLDLLAGLPVVGLDATTETVTPTGAALLATMVDRWGPIPTGRLVATARGAGGRDPATHPNVVTALVVETGPVASGGDGTATEPSVVVATNVDDVTPEVLAHLVEALLAAGADDAWIVPIVMKKGRPAHEVRVLCRPALVAAVARIVFAETGTLGLRTESVTKHVAPRRFEEVAIRGGTVRMKVGPDGAKPEHADLAELARATGAPLRALAAEALATYRETIGRSLPT